MTDRYNKLSKAVQNTKTSATTVARIFLEHYAAKHGIPFKMLTDQGPQFVSKFFMAVYSALVVNHITATEFHPQTSGQEERSNSTLISQLHHYVPVKQTYQYKYLLPLMYSYNVQVDRSIKVSASSFALTRAPSGPATVEPKRISIASGDNLASPMYAMLKLVR